MFDIVSFTTPPECAQYLPPGFSHVLRGWYWTYAGWRLVKYKRDIFTEQENTVRFLALAGAQWMGMDRGASGFTLQLTAQTLLICRNLIDTQKQYRITAHAFQRFRNQLLLQEPISLHTPRLNRNEIKQPWRNGLYTPFDPGSLQTTLIELRLLKIRIERIFQSALLCLWETNLLAYQLVETTESFSTSPRTRSEAFQKAWINLNKVQQALDENKEGLIQDLENIQPTADRFFSSIQSPIRTKHLIQAVSKASQVNATSRKIDNQATRTLYLAAKEFVRESLGFFSFTFLNWQPKILQRPENYYTPPPEPLPAPRPVRHKRLLTEDRKHALDTGSIMEKYQASTKTKIQWQTRLVKPVEPERHAKRRKVTPYSILDSQKAGGLLAQGLA